MEVSKMKYDYEIKGLSFLFDENHFVYKQFEDDKSIHLYVKSRPHSSVKKAGVFMPHMIGSYKIPLFIVSCRLSV